MRPRALAAPAPVRVLIIQNRFRLGGQEGQTLLHLSSVDWSSWEPVVVCLQREGEYLAAVEDLADLESLDVRKMARLGTLWSVAKLARRIRAERIALVHAQDFYSNVLGFLAARLAGVPNIVTRVDLGHVFNPVQRAALTAVSRASTRVLVNALAIRDQCISEGVHPDRIAVVRNGVDLTAFDAAATRSPVPPVPALDHPAVVSVANMHHPVKGQVDLLEAMREVVRAVPDARLVLVGDGVRRPMLEALAKDLRLEDHCAFLGHRRDVPAILARAAVAVSASHAEGISNAILEAMAARKPVVATAVGGSPELVRDGVNGRLVPPGAPAQLAGRLRELLQNRGTARRLGEAGRELVEREFGLDAMRLSYDALYRGVVAESEGRLSRLMLT